MTDGDLINVPYMQMIRRSADARFLGGINDGDAAPYGDDWIQEYSRIEILFIMSHNL